VLLLVITNACNMGQLTTEFIELTSGKGYNDNEKCVALLNLLNDSKFSTCENTVIGTILPEVTCNVPDDETTKKPENNSNQGGATSNNQSCAARCTPSCGTVGCADFSSHVCQAGEGSCPNSVNKDCLGTWDACTAACETSAQRTFRKTQNKSGTGSACPTTTNCQPGNGGCKADSGSGPNKNCLGTWSTCTSACETKEQRIFTETQAKSGTGSACPTTNDCQPGVGLCPLNKDCLGTWSACTSKCEASALRIFTKTQDKSGTGSECPTTTDCTPGKGECKSTGAATTVGTSPTEPALPSDACCEAMTTSCLACKNGTSEEAYCAENPGTYDCGGSSAGATVGIIIAVLACVAVIGGVSYCYMMQKFCFEQKAGSV